MNDTEQPKWAELRLGWMCLVSQTMQATGEKGLHVYELEYLPFSHRSGPGAGGCVPLGLYRVGKAAAVPQSIRNQNQRQFMRDRNNP